MLEHEIIRGSSGGFRLRGRRESLFPRACTQRMAREQELPFGGGFSGADFFPSELACYTIGKGQVPAWPLCRGYCASPQQRRARAQPLICIRMKSVSLESKPARAARAEKVNNKMSARLCAREPPFFFSRHLLFSARSVRSFRSATQSLQLRWDRVSRKYVSRIALRSCRHQECLNVTSNTTFIFISVEILSVVDVTKYCEFSFFLFFFEYNSNLSMV